MRRFFLLPVLLVIAEQSFAQQRIIDSIKGLISKSRADTTRVRLLQELAEAYRVSPDLKNQDSAVNYSTESLQLARGIGYKQGEIRSLIVLAKSIRNETNPVKAIEYFKEALLLSEEIKDTLGVIAGLNGYALIYYYKDDFRRELSYYWDVERLARQINDRAELKKAFRNIGNTLLRLDQPDSAETYIRKAMQLDSNGNDPFPIAVLGRIKLYKHNYNEALFYFRKALSIYEGINDKLHISQSYYDFARVYEEQQKWDSALYNYQISYDQGILDSDSLYVKVGLSPLLAALYEKLNNLPEALRYYKISIAANERAKESENLSKLLNLEFQEKERVRELELAKKEYANKVQFYSAVAGILVMSVIGYFLYRSNRQKQKAKSRIEKAYSELKSTQAQLIQSEKMASLGELTAGIAHEIQNPLNFVNNFSEINNELIDEMAGENNMDELKTLAQEIKQNNEKIAHHGKRAEAIVKGMLQHSRAATGEKSPTDINALTDEYLRLSLQAMRSKDKSFQVATETDFDKGTGKIVAVPQDVGRVLLNLFNNAFYAVNEKQKQAGPNFHPVVSVSTKRLANKVEIVVKDNGNGIPERLRNKIFQPFFTTKPTGEGTGLGLSLSYDIVTKGHDGAITVETAEGEGSKFIVRLPC